MNKLTMQDTFTINLYHGEPNSKGQVYYNTDSISEAFEELMEKLYELNAEYEEDEEDEEDEEEEDSDNE